MELRDRIIVKIREAIAAETYREEDGIDVEAMALDLGFASRHAMEFALGFHAAYQKLEQDREMVLQPVRLWRGVGSKFPGRYRVARGKDLLRKISQSITKFRKQLVRAHNRSETGMAHETDERIRSGIERRAQTARREIVITEIASVRKKERLTL